MDFFASIPHLQRLMLKLRAVFVVCPP